MASSGKKKQKGKGKTLSLNAFLADDKGASGPGASYVLANKPVNWGDEVDKEEAENDEPYDYGGSIKSKVDRAMLPTAPRAALGPDIDMDRVPTKPPFKAFLGNLPYDVSEEEIEKFFRNLTVVDIRLPEDQGRMKGFGYAEFQDRQSLVEALSLNDGLLRNRKLRIDLAGSTQDKDDRRHGGDDGEDRTVGDWRRKEDRPSGFDDRSRDRPSGFDDRSRDRDRYDDRRGERDDRDRGGDRYGDRYDDRYCPDYAKYRDGERDRYDRYDRGRYDRYDNRDKYGGRDRYDDNRDRYGGRDRYDDRRRYDDKDGGYGGDGRRQFGSGFRSDGDRYGDNRGSDRYGDNRGGDRYGPPRDRFGDRDRFDRDREYRGLPRDSSGEAKARPKLALQPRTKPIEETTQAPAKTSSIFGGAKPVDTAAREREIEERLYRIRTEDYDKIEKEKENRQRLNSSTSEKSRSRKDSSGSDGGSSSRRERKSSSSSGKGIRTVAPPPGAGSARVRSDSSRSDQEDVFVEDRDRHPISPSAKSKQSETPPKMVPAPPPKENIWEKRKEAQGGLNKDEEHLNKQEINQRQQDEDQKMKPVQPQDQKIESSEEDPGTEKSSPSQTKEINAEPPVGNVWEKRKQEREERELDDKPVANSENERGSNWGKSRGGGRGGGARGRGERGGRTGDSYGRDSRSGEKPIGDKPKRDKAKPLPTSYEQMPKYKESTGKNWSDANKFSYLVGDDEDPSDDQ